MPDKKQSWSLDQIAKSQFFHQKLHEWQLLEIASAIEKVPGETLDWDLEHLHISDKAWKKIIHRGIKPVIVFAHPDILTTITSSTSYYRMLAMVSQKSMNQIGLTSKPYEDGRVPDSETALKLTQHFNNILNLLIEADEIIDPHEFLLWRGMAAGAQAQGSWQNTKGRRIEILIAGMIQQHLRDNDWLDNEETPNSYKLTDGRTIVFADEPDIAIFDTGKIVAAIEIKGGIDKAGVLERVGAAIKSLSRAKSENHEAVTILLLQSISITPQSISDINANQTNINYWFTVEDVLENAQVKEKLFKLLHLL